MTRVLSYVRNHHLGLIAIFIALTGTAYAASKTAPKNSVITKSIRKAAVTKQKLAPNSVDGSKVIDGSLTGADLNVGTLGVVPNASHAAIADNATKADNASKADHATNADSAKDADHATNSDQLGGQSASAYLKGTDSVPGGVLGGTYAAPTLRGSGFGTAGPESLFSPEMCSSGAVSGPSVTVNVPASGFVEVLARVQFQTVVGNSLSACVVQDTNVLFQALSSTSVSAETRYTQQNSTSGTTTAGLAEWIPVFTTPGNHTFELTFGRSGGGSSTNQVTNRLLLVRALS